MTDPTDRLGKRPKEPPEHRAGAPTAPDRISEAARQAVAADRARVLAAEHAARRRRRSLAGRLERVLRWLRNRQSGPLPRLRRIGGVAYRTVRHRGPWRPLPEALATALLAPVRPGTAPTPRPPRDWAPDRAAAAARLAAFAARHDLARPRVAVIADAPAIEAYRADWDIVAIRPEDWRDVLSAAPVLPDLLVVDSARDGNGGAWTYRIAWTAHPDGFLQRDLRALVGWCTAHSIPAVFRARDDGALSVGDWSDAAMLFDVILTADAAAAVGYEALPDRRGSVASIIWADGDGAAVIRAIRAAA